MKPSISQWIRCFARFITSQKKIVLSGFSSAAKSASAKWTIQSPSFVSALADRSNGKPEDTFLGASQLDETKLDNFAASLNTQEIYRICAIKVATY
jgi:hypothetical protein